jgi:predicted aldo/keto reductase-like oxidoreductase
VKWDFVQIQMNYLDWKHAKTINPSNTNAEYLYSELEKRGIPVVIMEPLLGGRLANVPQHVAEHFVERAPGRSIASWAFRFVGSHPGVLCALSGMTYMEHLQDNLRTFSPLEQLTEEDFVYLDQISDVLSKHPTIPCVDCKYCMPCPYGLDIPGIFLHYNKCVNEGDIIADKSDDNYKKARRAFLVGYDRSVPKLRQADHCIKCGECVSACPQRIRIPREMEKIHQYVESLKRGL